MFPPIYTDCSAIYSVLLFISPSNPGKRSFHPGLAVAKIDTGFLYFRKILSSSDVIRELICPSNLVPTFEIDRDKSRAQNDLTMFINLPYHHYNSPNSSSSKASILFTS